VGQEIRLYGHPAQIEVFDAPVDLLTLLRSVAAQQPQLQDLHVLPGRVILSGFIYDKLWVAHLESLGPRRTIASLSALSMRIPQNTRGSAPSWMLAGAILRLDFSVVQPPYRVTERIWNHSWAPARVLSLLQQRLRQAGWMKQDDVDGANLWTLGDARLSLHVSALQDQGSGVLARTWEPL
jgi:hypothetical protein